jgi:hypothetical protein
MVGRVNRASKVFLGERECTFWSNFWGNTTVIRGKMRIGLCKIAWAPVHPATHFRMPSIPKISGALMALPPGVVLSIPGASWAARGKT